MITFVDGPARGQSLMLRRAPVLLRVVRSPDGSWDGLDQLSDTPDSEETIYVYRCTERPTAYFVDYRGPKGGRRSHGGQSARYRYFEHQPKAETLRSNHQWREWCRGIAIAEAEVPPC